MMKQLLYLLLPFALLSCNDPESSRPARHNSSWRVSENGGSLFQASQAYKHCAELCALGPRCSGTPAYEEQLRYLEEELKATGWTCTRDNFTAPNGTKMCNLRAVYGQDCQPRPLLVSCHIDTKSGIGGHFVGADDGASAAAVMLELARALINNAEEVYQVELIFLDGEESFAPKMTEEDGLYGSRYDVKRRGKDLPKWQINLDMVGGGNNVMAIPAFDSSQFMYEQYSQAVEQLRLPPEKWTAYPGSYLDDHKPYLDAGVDSLNIICKFQGSDWWHTQKDGFARISEEKLNESGKMTLLLINKILKSGR